MDIDQLLTDFKAEISTSSPSAVQATGIRTKVGHVRTFLEFMCASSEGRDDQHRPATVACLLAKDSFNAFFSRGLRKYTPTTKEHYIRSLCAFVRYVSDCRPPGLDLDEAALSTLARRLKQERAALSPKITLHRLTLMREKSRSMLSGDDCRDFLRRAPAHITAALEELETGPILDYATVTGLVGLVVAYFTTATGIRRGCFLGMTPEDLERAQTTEGEGICLSLGTDKTCHVYGDAQLPLKDSEHAWLRRYAALRHRLPGYNDPSVTGGDGPETFFFNSRGKPLASITVHVKAAYKLTLGRSGVTPTCIRSAVATVSERQLSDLDQSNVAKAMGHRRKTRDRHYVQLR